MDRKSGSGSGAGGLRFHWRLPLAGEEPGAASAPPAGVAARALPDLPAHVAFCELAEQNGIDSLLMACGFYMPDPVPLVAALGTATRRIRFMLAYRSGLISPTAFVQQVNTLAALTGGRVSLNMVVGHSQEEQRCYGDFLAHDERYHRSAEFLAICRAFWHNGGAVDFAGKYYRVEGGRLGTPFLCAERAAPEIYLGGGSPLAREIAARHADCWLRLGDAPEKLRPEVAAMRAQGVEVGIRLSLIARPTREEALAAAAALLAQGDEGWVRQVFVSGSDSDSMRAAFARAADGAHWPAPYLWTGAVASRGPSAVCLVGTPVEIADALLEYRRLGVSQVILSSWSSREALAGFGREILPLVRKREAQEAGGGAGEEAAAEQRVEAGGAGSAG
ncbi:MAG TPA: LLM class flavin-dependent oxidoreductase [Thermoanaerobaculia bacterium]|nr:LLM class flavin-dependent oxidoreductase [Thermoanaerobaculia bacterium]